uniref:Cyclin-dependent kinase-like 2 n=1 Tax=Stegastes partitus TaxID=144197 RepID=A0A3B4ZY42_9TELE
MERYESLGPVGEGSYGTVLKCRHRDSGRLVAIKKFMDSDDDKAVKKIALREIKLLRQLRHDNLVNLLEVWKRRRRWYLVFEFVDRTLLEDLEHNPTGLDLNTSRQYLYQILRATAFCHQQNIIHRDIKPENILISQGGVVKLCDFGFARTVASPSEGGVYTDYVATRWYRAPELLVGDIKYGKPVDVWALGCLLIEMLTGQPLFPGDSDLDQIYHIIRCFGNLTTHHQELFYRNPVFSGVRLPECSGRVQLQQRFPTITPAAQDLAQMASFSLLSSLQIGGKLTDCIFLCLYRFLDELNAKIQKDHRENSTLPKITKNLRQEREDSDEKNHRDKHKKQPEDMDEKFNKEKTEKTKGKQPSKVLKTIRNTSEPLIAIKQPKTIGSKGIHNAVQSPMKSKPGKTTGGELRKGCEISKSTKTSMSETSDATKTVTSLKENNRVAAKPKHEKVMSPGQIEDSLKNIKDKDCRASDNTKSSATEVNKVEICRSPKSEPSQEFGKSWNKTNTKVPKLPKGSTTDHANVISSPKVSLESAVDQTDTNMTLELSQPPSSHHTEVATKPCKTSTTSERQTDQSTGDMEQRTSESLKVQASNHKPATSNLKSNRNTLSLPTSPSKTLTSDLSALLSTVIREASPAPSAAALPQGLSNPKVSKTGSTLQGPPKGSALTEDKDLKEDQGFLKVNPVTEKPTNEKNPESFEPSSLHQQATSKSKIITETRTTSTSMLNENALVGTNILKTLKVSNKEILEDLALSVSISTMTKFSVNQSLNVPRSSSDFEPDGKSLKAPYPKSVVGEPKTKPGSFSNSMRSTVTPKTQKTTFATDPGARSENPERHDTTDLTSVSSTVTPDTKASTRNSVIPNMDDADLNEFDFRVPHSSPPPPPPPPSSTPLLLPPSATSVIPSNSPAAGDHLTPGAGFHPGTHSFRYHISYRVSNFNPLEIHFSKKASRNFRSEHHILASKQIQKSLLNGLILKTGFPFCCTVFIQSRLVWCQSLSEQSANDAINVVSELTLVYTILLSVIQVC